MIDLETRILQLRHKQACIAMQLALKRIALAYGFKYSPDQPRDDHGRWTSGGGAGAADVSGQAPIAAPPPKPQVKPIQLALNDTGSMSDAGILPVQPNEKTAAAADYATAHAKDRQTGQCAKYVRAALNNAGIPLTPPPTRDGASAPWARDYGPQLEKVGFTPIVDEPGTNGFGATYPPPDYMPQKGDVAVMDPPRISKTPAGHIAIYNGDQWVSDYKQDPLYGMYPGSIYGTKRPSFKIYRMPP